MLRVLYGTCGLHMDEFPVPNAYSKTFGLFSNLSNLPVGIEQMQANNSFLELLELQNPRFYELKTYGGTYDYPMRASGAGHAFKIRWATEDFDGKENDLIVDTEKNY